jgi:hypothetical protein
MRPKEELSNGTEEVLLERMEDLLRSAADFEPETEATYNFAAAAMSRRRFRSRAVWMTAAGCACTALFVWCTVPRVIGPANIWTNPAFVVDEGTNDSVGVDEEATGTSVQNYRHVPFIRPQQSPLRPDRAERSASSSSKTVALPATWEKEEFDRYASGLVEPTFVEERAPDGSIVRKPAVAVTPLESGERPAAAGGNNIGVLSVANYDASQGEGTK